MPRQFFRRVSREYRRKEPPRYLRSLHRLVEHPTYFAVNRRSVAGGVALGLLVGLMPIPGHVPVVLVSGLMVRVNLAVAALMIWISNPLTYGPIFYAEYRIGAFILRLPPGPPFEFSWDGLTTGLGQVWQPLLLGSVLLGAAVAGGGYFAVSWLWQWSARRRYRRRWADRR